MRSSLRRLRDDAGFTIVEVLTALAVIGVVLTSTTALYVRSMLLVDEQGTRQTALQVATDGMEAFRGVSNLNTLAWLQTGTNANQTKTLNNLPFTLTWKCATGKSTDAVPDLASFVPCYNSTAAAPFVPARSDYDVLYAQLVVGWNGRTCPDTGCTYAGAITEISTAAFEPTFDTLTS